MLIDFLAKIAEAILTMIYVTACAGGILFALATMMMALGLEGLATIADAWRQEL